MQTVVIASSEADAAAAAAVEQHHAQMSGRLTVVVEALIDAASRRDAEAAAAAQKDLLGWCERELVPHALAEETTLYRAARETAEGRLLVDGLVAEHEVITNLVHELTSATDPVRAAATATALRSMFESHQAKENDLLLPLLVAAPGVSVADLLTEMHETFADEAGSTTAAQDGCGGGHTCACGEAEAPGLPELDARGIPHAIRHATIFGALDAVPRGGGLILVAPHDPLPLLAQVEQRAPGVFRVEYLERGPEAWRLSFVRRP